MPDAAPATKLQIAMNFLADGRVGVELMEGWYLSHDLQVAAVDDLAATSEILRGWASHPHEKPRPRREAYVQFPEHTEGYLVILSAQPNESLRRFTETPDALCRNFDLVFGSADLAERAAAADRLADDLASEMRTFVTRSRRKAAARLAGGSYLAVLEAHLATLRAVRAIEDQRYYDGLEWGIGGIMQDEKYLLLSDDAQVRDLYLQIEGEQDALYGWYMDLAKGGVARKR